MASINHLLTEIKQRSRRGHYYNNNGWVGIGLLALGAAISWYFKSQGVPKCVLREEYVFAGPVPST